MGVPVALRFCVGDERALRDVDERRERAAEPVVDGPVVQAA